MATSPVPRGVLWDLDGTLIDSAEAHYLAWHETLAERGHEHSGRSSSAASGSGTTWFFGAIFGDALAPEEAERLADVKEERYRRHVREHGVELCAGATDWLTRLREAGFRQALATSAPPENVTVVVEVLGLERYIDATASARDVERGKPDPAIFLEAARRIGGLARALRRDGGRPARPRGRAPGRNEIGGPPLTAPPGARGRRGRRIPD